MALLDFYPIRDDERVARVVRVALLKAALTAILTRPAPTATDEEKAAWLRRARIANSALHSIDALAGRVTEGVALRLLQQGKGADATEAEIEAAVDFVLPAYAEPA